MPKCGFLDDGQCVTLCFLACEWWVSFPGGTMLTGIGLVYHQICHLNPLSSDPKWKRAGEHWGLTSLRGKCRIKHTTLKVNNTSTSESNTFSSWSRLRMKEYCITQVLGLENYSVLNRVFFLISHYVILPKVKLSFYSPSLFRSGAGVCSLTFSNLFSSFYLMLEIVCLPF